MKIVCCLLLTLVLPSGSWAQLVPGEHWVTPIVGATFPTNDLLHAAAPLPIPRPGPDNPVVADIGLDPGAFAGLRYSYNLTRRLMVEVEASYSIAVFAVQLLEIMPDADPNDEPQFELTTTDGRVAQYFLNMSYVFGRWNLMDPFFTVGVGTHNLDLRQKGEVNADTILDRAFMAGFGLFINVHPRLKIRAEFRDYMYNFSFDNQFVGDRADQVIDPVRRPGFHRITAAASPRFQNDLAVTVGFQIHPF